MNGGVGKTVACAACHGEGFERQRRCATLAGRSPSYLARQLYDIEHFMRNGQGIQLMRPVVRNLSKKIFWRSRRMWLRLNRRRHELSPAEAGATTGQVF